jgi:hypothetical protein
MFLGCFQLPPQSWYASSFCFWNPHAPNSTYCCCCC